MGSAFLIILCTTLFINVSIESNTDKNDRKYKIFLQKMQNEGYIKIAKRSVSRVNEIGGSNDNGIIVTTAETNAIQYSAPHFDPAHQVNVKLITTTTNAGSEKEKVASFNSSESDNQKNSVIGTYNETQKNETTAAEGSLDKPVNDINNSFTSDNNSVNNKHNLTAITGSAILSSYDSGAILSEHSLSNVLSQSKNDTSDVFATPVTATRENAGQVNTSASHVSNMITGNTTLAGMANKMNNSTPQVTEESIVSNAIVQTTQDSVNSTSSEFTFLPKNEGTSNMTLPLSFQTTTAPESGQTLTPGSRESQSANNTDENSLVRETTTVSSNKSGNDDSENLNQTLTLAFPISSTPEAINTTSSNTTGEESLPENEMGEPENSTLSNLPASEPEPQAEPVPGSENNTDIITDHPVNTTTAVLDNTETTVGSLINTTTEQVIIQTTKSVGNTTSVPENIDEPSLNETVSTDKLKQGSTATISVTPIAVIPDAVMPNATGDEPEGNITTTKYSTNFKSTEQQNQSTTESISTISSFAVTNITSFAEPEGQVTAEPAEKMTKEPKENDTFSKSVGENTTVFFPGENTTTIYQVTTTNNKMSVPSQEASLDAVTTTPKPLDKETTTVTNTGEPSSEPENYSPSKHEHTDISTQSSPRNPIQETTSKIINDEKGEAESESEDSEPEPEKEQEPENEPDQFNFDSFAEPGPDWELAKASWKEAWEFHVYFFGIAFALLGVYCLLTLIRLWNMEHMLSKHYFITLHLLVILVCILRTTYLMIDAYNSLGTFPYAVDYFLYSTAFPCLTALFSILFYALLLATRVQIISKKVQKLWVLILIIAFHFILSITTDIVVSLFSSASVMIFICQAFFILWGLLMFVGYLVIFRKLYKGAIYRKKNFMSSHFEHKNNSANVSTKQKFTLGLAVKVTLISALFGVAYIGFELYGMFGVYGVLKSKTKPEPWPWWTYHTIVRSLEVFMCLTVAYVASQPLRYKMNKNVDHRIYHYLLPCSICCCPDNLDQNDIYNSSISLDYVISETDHLSWLKKMKNKNTPSPEAPYPPHTAEKYADPDATLLVRKVRRSSKPSMLVVEDGFVRIRREDEVLPSNQYELELDSVSSHSSGSNDRHGVTNVINRNYASVTNRSNNKNETGVNFNDYILQGNVANRQMTNNEESDEDTDIDIVVTESEHEDDNRQSPDGVISNKSDDLFRPLSMIDLATSIESELDRAFNSSCVEEIDLISHNSLPISFDGYNTESNGCAYNEHLCDKYGDSVNDSTQYSSDSADDQSKSSAVRLLQPPVRRCKSDDSKSSSQKFKNFERNKYFSVSGVDSISKDDEVNTHFGSNGELRTDL